MTIKTVDAAGWKERLHADTDGSVHMEWLSLEAPLLRTQEDNLASPECEWDGTRAEVWRTFDKSRLPPEFTTPWPGSLSDGTWLLSMRDKTATFTSATYAWAHALSHKRLDGVLTAMQPVLAGAPQNMPTPWLVAETFKKIITHPDEADALSVPLTSLMAVLRHNSRSNPNGRSIHELLQRELPSRAMDVIINFYEDADTCLGMVGDMHQEFARVFPLSGYLLLLGDDDLSDDAEDLIEEWPAAVQASVSICQSLGMPTRAAACRAWADYRGAASPAIPLPGLDAGSV